MATFSANHQMYQMFRYAYGGCSKCGHWDELHKDIAKNDYLLYCRTCGVCVRVPVFNFQDYIYQQGGQVGKYRSAHTPNHSNPAQGAGTSARAYGSTHPLQAALNNSYAQQAASTSVAHQQTLQAQMYAQLAYRGGIHPWLGIDFAKKKAEPLSRTVQTGEIIAWRGWRVNNRGNLSSIAHTHVEWLPGEALTVAPPDEDFYSHTGIHAFKTREDAVQYLTVDYRSNVIVLGQVALWGEVVEGTAGYRAQSARIVGLDSFLNANNSYNTGLSNSESIKWLRELRERYKLEEEP